MEKTIKSFNTRFNGSLDATRIFAKELQYHYNVDAVYIAPSCVGGYWLTSFPSYHSFEMVTDDGIIRI